MVPTARPTSTFIVLLHIYPVYHKHKQLTYIIGFNSTIAVSTSGDSNVTISLYALVGIIIGSAVFLAILVVLVYHLIVRKRSSKVEDGSSSFKVFVQVFVFLFYHVQVYVCMYVDIT
jgi:hypothetical protein